MVKFAKEISAHCQSYSDEIDPEAYINYKQLKKCLKNRPDEFFDMWEQELFKVRDFISDSGSKHAVMYSCSAGNTIVLDCVLKRTIRLTHRAVEALQEFTRVNREGFRKILKKHDKVTGKSDSASRLAMVNSILSDPVSDLDALLSAAQPHGVDGIDEPVMCRYLPGLKRKWVQIGAILAVGFTFAMVLAFGVEASKIGNVFVVGVAASFILALANGANDIANSVGTSVGAGAISLRQAVVWGCMFEFLGAISIGPFVAKTISKGMILPEDYNDNPDMFALAMLSTLIGAAVTTLLATAYGFPISATHSIVGGLIAVGMAAKGTESVGWSTLGETSIGWVLSPVVGAVISAIVFFALEKTVIQTAEPAKNARRMQPVFTIITAAVCFLFMFVKGPKPIQIQPLGAAVGVALAGGVGVALIMHVYNRCRARRQSSGSGVELADVENGVAEAERLARASAGQSPVATEDAIASDGAETQLTRRAVAATNGLALGEEKNAESGIDSGDSGDEGGTDDDWEPDADAKAAARKQQLDAAEQPFVGLLVASAFTVAFAHGGNDVGNAVGPLAAILGVYKDGVVAGTPDIPFWALCVGGAGFCFGIVLLGSRTISTVGTKITKLTPSKSYATQIGAAVAVLVASSLGLPVSTSHCLVGSVIGIGICQKCLSPEPSSLNFGVLKKIVLGWAVTIPLAMLVSVAIFLPLQPIFFLE